VPVGQPDVLAADAFRTEVHVLHAELGRPLQRGRGQLPQRVSGELRIDGLRVLSTVLHEWQPIPGLPGTLAEAAVNNDQEDRE
jgi:hypothetical protein